nr:hypothetical protein [uncultured Actinoplanes sp.]
MDDKPRFAIRRGAVALTRRQWIAVGAVLAGGIVAAIVLGAAVSPAAAAIALGVAVLVATLIRGFGHPPD